jgi:hypothetical protein
MYSFNDGNPPIADEQALVEGYDALRNLEHIKAEQNEGKTLSCFQFLIVERSRLAKELVNRVYALLGLAEKTDTVYVAKLPIEYSEEIRASYWRVYAEFRQITL